MSESLSNEERIKRLENQVAGIVEQLNLTVENVTLAQEAELLTLVSQTKFAAGVHALFKMAADLMTFPDEKSKVGFLDLMAHLEQKNEHLEALLAAIKVRPDAGSSPDDLPPAGDAKT